MKYFPVIFIIILLVFSGCKNENAYSQSKGNSKMIDDSKLEIATLGGGCFWCTEAIFENVKGVHSVISGYSGGARKNPTYEQVCSGATGHAEVVQVKFDPNEISYDEILEIFFKTHDPTTLNRQGADVGTQYRSVIFYNRDEQKQKAEFYKSKLNEEKIWKDPIVTEISPLKEFYEAEKYHQDYYENNPNQGYCSFVITPKLEKFKKVFKEKLK